MKEDRNKEKELKEDVDRIDKTRKKNYITENIFCFPIICMYVCMYICASIVIDVRLIEN